jgi:hypothetical protein
MPLCREVHKRRNEGHPPCDIRAKLGIPVSYAVLLDHGKGSRYHGKGDQKVIRPHWRLCGRGRGTYTMMMGRCQVLPTLQGPQGVSRAASLLKYTKLKIEPANDSTAVPICRSTRRCTNANFLAAQRKPDSPELTSCVATRRQFLILRTSKKHRSQIWWSLVTRITNES